MTLKTLSKLKSKWQKRLRIQDWDIELKLVRHNKFSCGESGLLGACFVESHKKCATVELVDERDVTNKSDDPTEIVLVHELLHVVMPMIDLKLEADDSNPSYIAYERVVDQLAKTLVEAYSVR